MRLGDQVMSSTSAVRLWVYKASTKIRFPHAFGPNHFRFSHSVIVARVVLLSVFKTPAKARLFTLQITFR